jgi:hypothetical protein
MMPSRFYPDLLILTIFFFISIGSPPRIRAQDDDDAVPLGDIARSLRRQEASPTPETVIDNDNLAQVMESAENRRGDSSLLYSLDAGSKNLRVSSPDVTCSLSFSANSSSLLADPLALNEMPRTEMAKLDGPATIDGDTLAVTVRNGSSWEVHEIVVGLTIIRQHESGAASYYGGAKVVAAAAGESTRQDSSEKQADMTVLLHMKGLATPGSTAVFRATLNFELFPDQEWHWAIVKAKGIPPQVNPQLLTAPDEIAGARVATAGESGTLSAIPSLPALPPPGPPPANPPNPSRSTTSAPVAPASPLP